MDLSIYLSIYNFMTSSIFMYRNVKNLLRKQKKLYRKYKTYGFKDQDKVKVDNIRGECFTAITVSKESDLKSGGSKLIGKNTGQKTCILENFKQSS